MYKIAQNTIEFDIINQTAHSRNPETTDKYADIIKHCKQDLYALPLIPTVLNRYGLEFITEEWLSTDIVETLPTEWTWYRMDRPIRLIMQTQFVTDILLQQNELAELISLKLAENKQETPLGDFITKDNIQTIAYFYKIDEGDVPIVTPYIMSGDIIIEQLNN
jgi:hypothetical protein